LTKFSPVQEKKKKKKIEKNKKKKKKKKKAVADQEETVVMTMNLSLRDLTAVEQNTIEASIQTMQEEEDSQGSNSCPKPGTLVWEKALTLQESSEEHLA